MKYLKQMMRVPHSTASVGLYLEHGILPTGNETDRRQTVFLHDIVTLEEDPVN